MFSLLDISMWPVILKKSYKLLRSNLLTMNNAEKEILLYLSNDSVCVITVESILR